MNHGENFTKHDVRRMEKIEAAWIGLTNKFADGVSFYWTDETAVDFLDWDHPHEPSRDDWTRRFIVSSILHPFEELLDE